MYKELTKFLTSVILFLSIFFVSFLGKSEKCYAHDVGAPALEYMQDKTITGRVTDSSGAPLPGVTVYVKNDKTIGTTTDLNGRYILAVPDHAVLIFSMVGFDIQEAPVDERNTIDIKLLPSSNQLGETVVVAFGKQKKENVVGAITTINPEELKIPSSNLTTALAGRVAGIIAYQRSGEPGNNNAAFFIRGVTTFGYNKSPLILIDQVEATTDDLARLQVDDIASFSILKDAASTALYGNRAANGVILITTKQGKEGKAKYFVRVENDISTPTQNVRLANPVTYMKLANEAATGRDPLSPLPYSLDKINNTVPGKFSYIYPAVDWKKTLFKPYTMNQRVVLSVNGGGSVARYYVSGSFTQDNGVFKVPKANDFNNNINLKTYSVRSNVDISLSKSTLLTVRVAGIFDDYMGPLSGGDAMYNEIMHASPVLFPAYYKPDSAFSHAHHILFGNADNGQYANPYADMVKGYKNYSATTTRAQADLKQDLSFVTPGLSLNAMAYTQRYAYFDVSRAYNPYYYKIDTYDGKTGDYTLDEINTNTGTEYLSFPSNGGTRIVSSEVYLQAQLNYSRTFKEKHSLGGTLVYQMENNLSGQYTNLEASLPFRNLGVSGRANYSYDERYNLEFDFGYNGSESFAPNHRWGFFPSVGVSWNVSKEAFWEQLKPVIGNLKIRATYGLVGNDAINDERFFYLSNVNLDVSGKTGTFGTNFDYTLPGVDILRYANPDVTWEVARKADVGIDMDLGRGFTIEADYFHEYRYNILMTRNNIPANMGLQQSAVPLANVGAATNQGVDGSVNYNRFITRDFWIQGRANFTYAHSEYKIYEEPHYLDAPWLSHIGQPISQQWGYVAEHLFVDNKEVHNSPEQSFGEYKAGDIKYMDMNDDGQITTKDEVPIGYPTDPEIVYGFGISTGYKNFDISFFFQGTARESFWIDASATAPFQGYTQLLKAYADDHWSLQNQDIYALWPRLSPVLNNNDIQQSTWFMRNGSFLRLKQVELGYSLPRSTAQKLHIQSLRFYLNASNVFLLSHFKLWDVEMAGNGLGYPLQRVVNVGFTTNF